MVTIASIAFSYRDAAFCDVSHIISFFEPALLADLVNFDVFIITIITTDTVERFAKFVGVCGSKRKLFLCPD